MMRRAISPRLATRMRLNTLASNALQDGRYLVVHGGGFVAALVDFERGAHAESAGREDRLVHGLNDVYYVAALAFDDGAHGVELVFDLRVVFEHGEGSRDVFAQAGGGRAQGRKCNFGDYFTHSVP